jgi:hypothetical protein
LNIADRRAVEKLLCNPRARRCGLLPMLVSRRAIYLRKLIKFEQEFPGESWPRENTGGKNLLNTS